MIDPSTALAFSLFENRGVYALLLGSGISRSAQIPTGWEITLDLTRRLGLLEGETDQPNWAAWHEKRFGRAPNYSELLDVLASTPAERRTLLHGYIEPTAEDLEQGRRSPTEAHKAIARLVRDSYIKVIVTTNFDRLLETALRAEGVEPTVVRSDDDLAGAEPLSHARCYVVKIHGDYMDTRLRNTEDELAAYSAPQDALLDRIIDEHGLIVCGWSSDWDAALRAAITRAPSRRYPLYWASRGDPSATALDLIAQRGGKVISIESADSFFVGLQGRVEAQAESQRPNPLSVELLNATIKKQLARPESRIVLGDTVQQEIKRVQKGLGAAQFNPNVRPDADQFRARVVAYNALCEPLVRVAFTLGRWGDGSEVRLAEDLVLAFAERPLGGYVIWQNLVAYPAVLLMWAYCLGAATSARHDVILRMLHMPIHEEHRSKSDRAVMRLTPEIWSGDAKALWETFPGMERHYLPACDVLMPVFEDWLSDEFLSPRAFNQAWGWTEILYGMEFTAERISKADLAVRLEKQDGRACVASPIGRTTYDSELAGRLLERLSDAKTQASLASNGFGGGDAEFIVLIQRNMLAWIGEAGWP